MRSGRVVVLSDYIGGEGAASGGAGHAALDSYRALRDAGADVRMVAGFGTAPVGEAARFASLGGNDLRAGGTGDMARAIYNRSARNALAAELADADRDTTLIVLHQWTRYLSPAALGLVDRFPTMIYMHDYFWPCPNGAYYDFREQRPCDRRPMGVRCLAAACDKQGRAQKLGRVARQATRQALTRAGAERRLFLHLSERARRTAAPLLPGERHAVITNSQDVGEASPAAIPCHDVGYFGRLEPEKGVGDLIDAVAALGATALIVGEGSLASSLAGRAGIEHRAWQPREAMAAAMRSCAVVALPSRWDETWGLIVPEAMAAGVPVLASVRAGSAELVRRFGGGATFDPGVQGDLRTRLELLLRQPPAPVLRDGLRRFLSAERHAAWLMDLSRHHFGLDLRSGRGGISDPVRADPEAALSPFSPPPPR